MRNLIVGILFATGLFSLQLVSAKSAPDVKTISKTVLLDKIKGGWAGKAIGCTYGGPVEFRFNGSIIPNDYPIEWNKDRLKWYYDNSPGLYDDMYVNIVLDEVIERLGFNAPADSFAVSFARAGFPLWHANASARYNVQHGIMPPLSGHWLNNPHADDIDFQIEADFIGLITPGMANTGSELADRVGHIFNYGDGWYGGVFVAAMYSNAFFYNNAETVVRNALRTIPEKSDFYQCINDILTWHKMFPTDWKRTWFECEKKWASEVGCSSGVLSQFDIDAKINSAYVVIGLLYGDKNFYKTIDIAARCGQDSDCNASTSGGVLGAMIGYSNIPERWKEGANVVEDRPFSFTDVSLNKLYEMSLSQACSVVEKNGGKITDDMITVNYETPVAVRYEKGFDNHYPMIRYNINKALTDSLYECSFEGIGFVVRGNFKCVDKNYIAKIKMFVDGKDEGNVDMMYINGGRDEVCFKYNMPNGKHTLGLKWLNPNPDAQVTINNMLLYSNQRNKLDYNE